jgi:hypothetical protein
MSDNDTPASPQTHRRVTDEERALIPFDYLHIRYNLADLSYEATFQDLPIWTESLNLEWAYLDDTLPDISLERYNSLHPGIEHISNFDQFTGTGQYHNRNVRWSISRACWVYNNNREVEFDEAEVSTILSEPPDIPNTPTPSVPENLLPSAPENAPAPSAPENPLPSAPENTLPTPTTQGPRAGPSRPLTVPPRPASPSHAPVRRPRTTAPLVNPPAPPVNPPAPPMAAAAGGNAPRERILGAHPEPFDGKAANAETFWNSLENYYYLNDNIFPDQGRKVAAALTHFKLGTPAGDWARDRARDALDQNPIEYGTWADFKTAFAAHFIPAESALEASALMHSLRQGSRPFNEWYQEWSSHASRANVDANTKMYAFRRMLNQSLHQKILGISPAPTTMATLVEKAREFDRLYHLYQTPAFRQGGGPNRPARARGVTTEDNDSVAINLYQGTPGERSGGTTPRGPLSKEERKRRFDNKLCLYCGKPGHMMRECRARAQNQNQGRTPGNNQRNSTNSNQKPRVRSTTAHEEDASSDETPIPMSTLYTWRDEFANAPRPKSAPQDF